jgi:hypothetical protein
VLRFAAVVLRAADARAGFFAIFILAEVLRLAVVRVVAMLAPLLSRANHPRQKRITAESTGQILTSGKSDYRSVRTVTVVFRMNIYRKSSPA